MHFDSITPKEFRYAPGAKPAVADELIAFRARPEFRMVEIVGATIDRCLCRRPFRKMAQFAGLSMAHSLAVPASRNACVEWVCKTRGTEYRPRVVAR